MNGAVSEETRIDAGQPDAKPAAVGNEQQLQSVRDYRLIEEIGKGGMGTVYKAVHEKLGRTVAIKFLPPHLGDGEPAARFQREMLTIGKLDHPNVVRATDGGEDDGRHFLVMEYLDGIDAGLLLKQRGSLSVTEACEIIRQAAFGLQHIHENDLVYRDIKPSNLFLSGSETQPVVRILDLGLARWGKPQEDTGELSTTGQVMGTVDYMAPEQTTGGNVDIRADIYGLGATFYQLLTGVAPFTGEDYQTVAQKLIGLVQDDVTPIRALRPDVPEAVATIVHRMLAKSPDDRFETPLAVVEALDDVSIISTRQQDSAGWHSVDCLATEHSLADRRTLWLITQLGRRTSFFASWTAGRATSTPSTPSPC